MFPNEHNLCTHAKIYTSSKSTAKPSMLLTRRSHGNFLMFGNELRGTELVTGQSFSLGNPIFLHKNIKTMVKSTALSFCSLVLPNVIMYR